VLLVVEVIVIEDYIGGERVGEVVKWSSVDNDLFTANFIDVFWYVFFPFGIGASMILSTRDDTGADREFFIKVNMGSGVSNLFNTYNCGTGVSIRLGSGSSPPSRDDYRLESEIHVITNLTVIRNIPDGFVVIEGVVSFPSDVTICEVGLSFRATVSGGTGCGEFLLDRTVFSPCRSIPAGTPYRVRYRVQF
jgi:hypothetical protein